jgi:hypothetical protein
MEDSWNTVLHRLWDRKHTWVPPREDYWDECDSTFVTPFHRLAELNAIYFQLPNGQEVRLLGTSIAIIATSGEESIYQYVNVTDSWIDVKLERRVYHTGSWHPWFYLDSWRTFGTDDADIWDAPPFIQDRYSSWPPQDTDTVQHRTILCDHITGHAAGSVEYDNANNINDVYRTDNDGLDETDTIAFKGTWSNRIYRFDPWTPWENETVVDVVGTAFRKMRVEKRSDYYRIWIGFGDGDPGFTGDLVDAIDGDWDSRPYTLVFDILADRTLRKEDYGTNISWPTFDSDSVLYDSVLNVQKPGFLFLPDNPFNIMGPVGEAEIFRIIDEAKDHFRNRGYTDPYIEWAYAQPLVKKPPVIT